MPLESVQRLLKPRSAIAAAASIAIGLMLAATAVALDVKPVAGTYAIGSATLVDPPPNEKRDRLLLYLEGNAAREVYEAMTAPVRISACDSDLRTKTAGALECSLSKAGEYTCSVGVSLERGMTVAASVC